MEIVSRQEALEHRLKRYLTGKPCKNGHTAERFTSTRGCVECCRRFNADNFSRRYSRDQEFASTRNAKSRAWAAANPEKNRARQRRWNERNPEKIREYNAKRDPQKARESAKRHRELFGEKVKAAIAAWRAKNKDQVKRLNQVHKHIRRAREKATGGSFTVADIKALHRTQNGRCATCPCTENLEIDHVHPVVLGGSSDPSNLQLLCAPCNRSKGAKTMDQWLLGS